ncbi:MAG: ABC transporter permease [Caldilineaceae bacterium]
MTVTTANSVTPPKVRKASRLNRFDSPWLNPKLLTGLTMVLIVALMPLYGPLIYNTKLVLYGSSPQNLPPAWGKSNIQMAFGEPTWDHPLGTQSDGRDMLAVLLVASPRSLQIGLIAAAISVLIGIILGFSAGFLGGWTDGVIRTLSDAIITIPALAVLIVIGSYLKTLNPPTMALLLACLSWAGPTRLIRAQVLSMRERGYVQMARLSGASTVSIMFKEIMPNLLPYLASSFTGNVSGAILAATGLEVLGLGSTRFPTLGMTIFDAIAAAAILRGMWWWWGVPIVALIWIFGGLYQITIGLDEIANPRLRGRV